jgi:hypothetical protein
MTLLAIQAQAQVADLASTRRLAPGVGLAVGAVLSLGLWSGLGWLAIRLIG